MIPLRQLTTSPARQLQNLGWDWLLGTDTLPYLTEEVVVVSEAEANAYAEAATELFARLIDAGQHVIDHNRFAELGIPPALIDLIRLSWDDDRHLHLYGRFDLAGGLAGQPIKLIEFNADTATCLPETAIVQFAHLRANALDELDQFNTVFETLTAQFAYLRQQNPDLTPSLLLSALRDEPEDDANVSLIGEAAGEAGFEVAYAYIDEVEFSAAEGVFRADPATGTFVRYDYWFKLVPWEYIGQEEPDLAAILTEAVRNRRVLVLNPAYTLLFQSKAILKILWEMFPDHPLLLPADSQPLPGRTNVAKVIFGREGANVRILNADGTERQAAPGDYADYPSVYQQYVEFLTDPAGRSYQAGVFLAGDPCGLGFRRGGAILDNTAQFVGHLIDG
jgi:glutathionylspermidine synthase